MTHLPEKSCRRFAAASTSVRQVVPLDFYTYERRQRRKGAEKTTRRRQLRSGGGPRNCRAFLGLPFPGWQAWREVAATVGVAIHRGDCVFADTAPLGTPIKCEKRRADG